MIDRPALLIVAVALAFAGITWARSARRTLRVTRRIEAGGAASPDVVTGARSALFKDGHAALVHLVAAVALGVGSVSSGPVLAWVGLLFLVPVGLTLRHGRDLARQSRLIESRAALEQRAEEVLAQESLAPVRWAERLAPEDVPDVAGFEFGTVYQAGTGRMAGDFYDVFRLAPTRVAAVIGDVTGHGIEPSITAFQAKYLLRVFLRQFRDPAQALEELNGQISKMNRTEEFISLCVVVFDTQLGTLRHASAGHPAAFLVQEGEVRYLEATGPLLSLVPDASYASREVPLHAGDTVLLYTDGLAEARSGQQLFGEDRIAAHLRREPDVEPRVLCKALVEEAEDFATVPITDDIAILAVRRA